MMFEMEVESVDTSYEPFSREPEYIEVNRLFIESLPLVAPRYILDLACGTGTLTELLLERIYAQQQANEDDAERSARVSIIGLDLSARSLQLAQANLAELTRPDSTRRSQTLASSVNAWTVYLAQASSDYLPIAHLSMDVVVIGNAIQLFSDKQKVVRAVQRVLCPGGIFAFNTSFYAGTYIAGTEGFYLRWVEEAVGYIARRDAELKQRGLPGIRRKKGLAKPAFSQPWLSASEYQQLLETNGFELVSIKEKTVSLTQRGLEAIGSFAGLASVLLSGYPVALACEALKESVQPALMAVNMQAVPRYWIEFLATRK